MQKDLTLESLEQSLEQSKKAELEKQQQIELESMNEFQKSLKTSLQTELDLIKEDILEMQKRVNKNNNIIIKEMEQGYTRAIELQRKREKTIYRYVIPFVIVAISAAVAMIAFSYLVKPPVTEWSVPPSSIDQEGKWISIEEAKNQGIHIHIRKGK